MKKRINLFALLCRNSLSKQLSLLTFLVAFLLLSTHCQWALGQSNNAPYFQILDRFGNNLHISDIELPANRPRGECDLVFENIQFQVDYQDLGTSFGFDAPSGVGEARQNVMCQVLTDVSHFIKSTYSYCDGNIPVVRIEVKESLNIPPIGAFETNTFAVGSPYYYNYNSAATPITGYAHSNVWRSINGGIDHTTFTPFGAGIATYDGYMQFNFNNQITWSTNLNSNNGNVYDATNVTQGTLRLDLYQAILREVMHMLGVHTWINADGSSTITNNSSTNPGLYTRYDKYLFNNNHLLQYVGGVGDDNCYNVNFTGNATALSTACNSISFKGIEDPTINLPVYTRAGTWLLNDYLMHIGNRIDNCDSYPYLLSRRMLNQDGNNNNISSPPIRRPDESEVQLLHEIGYQTTTEYTYRSNTVSASSFSYPTNVGTGFISAGNDDAFELGSCTEPLHFTCADIDNGGAVIDFDYLLQNDVNVLGEIYLDEECIFPITPGLDIVIVGTSIAISNAPPGTNVLAYIPTSNQGTLQQANTTFVYFTVDNCDSHCEGVYSEPCNLVCNPSLSTPCTPVPGALGWNFDHICFPECSNFPGWESAEGWVSYYVDGFNAPTLSGVSQIDAGLAYNTMLGFRAGAMEYDEPTFRGGALAANIALQDAGNYVLSFYNTLDAQEAFANNAYGPGVDHLTELHIALASDAALSNLTPCSAQNINYGDIDPTQVIDIYTQNNLQGSNWQQAIQCFNLPNNGTDYNNTYKHLLIYGVLSPAGGATSTMVLIDRVDLFKDYFSAQTATPITVNCNEQLPLGFTIPCELHLPNVTFAYQWALSADNGATWANIVGATATTYTPPPFTNTACLQYKLTRTATFTPDPNTNNPIIGNYNCLNASIIYQICTNCCSISANSNFTAPPATVCNTNTLVNLNPVNPNGTWTGNGATAITANVLNPSVLPYGDYTITYTVSVPNCPSSTQSATFSVTPACCVANAIYDTNPSPTTFDGRDAYIVPASDVWQPGSNPFNNAAQITVNYDIIVPDGVTLGLNEIDISFAPNARILVQRNGQLFTDGTPTTPTLLHGLEPCQTVWQGIQVEGPPNAGVRSNTAFGVNYGLFTDVGITTIQDAIIGIAAMPLPLMDITNLNLSQIALNLLPNVNGFVPTLTSVYLTPYVNAPLAHQNAGGVIKTTKGLRLIDCLQGINLSWYDNLPYQSDQVSSITYTSFESYGLVYPFSVISPNTINAEAGVHLNRYSHLHINKNTFNHLKYGIRGISATNLNIDYNTLTNNPIGISLLNGFGAPLDDNVIVAFNQLENNPIGMQFGGVGGLLVTENNINSGTLFTGLNNNPIGIFFRGCDFAATNNHLYNLIFGVALMANQTIGSQLCHNDIHTSLLDVWAFGDNNGVGIQKNTFDTYLAAISLQNYTNPLGFTWLDQNGMLSNQGNCDDIIQNPADNTFAAGQSIIPDIVSNVTQPFTYYCRAATNFVPTTNNPTTVIVDFGSCNNVEPYNDECNIDGLLLSDTDIKNLTEEAIKEREMRRKLYYYTREQNNPDAAKLLLEYIDNDAAKRLLIPYYIDKGEYTEAQNKLNQLPDTRLDDQYYKQIQTIYKNLYTDGRKIWELNPTEENTVRQIANSRTPVAYNAQALLYLARGEEFAVEMPTLPNFINPSLVQQLSVVFKKENNNTLNQPIGDVYPNPTNSLLQLDYNLGNAQAVFEFYDIVGRLVYSEQLSHTGTVTFTTQNIANGIYVCRVMSGNTVLKQTKVVVIK